MATIRQSRMVNMEGWRPTPPPGTPQSPPSDEARQRTGRSPYMVSSMPFATTEDSVTRQFYGGANAPTTRIFVPRED